jgi:hypothetical protein
LSEVLSQLFQLKSKKVETNNEKQKCLCNGEKQASEKIKLKVEKLTYDCFPGFWCAEKQYRNHQSQRRNFTTTVQLATSQLF